MNSVIRLDTRGRLVIPNEFRETLDLKEGDNVLQVASKLAELRVDLIMTESKSFERGKKARWDIIADISKLTLSPQEVKNELTNTGLVESASITQIARGGLHH